jgi:hypothetical protein
MTDSTTPEGTGTAHAARKAPPSGRPQDEQDWKDHHASVAELAGQEADDEADAGTADEVHA